MIDIRQTQEYANYLKKEGWVVERKENVNYFIRKLPLIGSILKVQRPEEINFQTIEKLCKKYRVFQVIIEPSLGSNTVSAEDNHNLLISHGYKLSKSPYLPSKTLQIDLRQPIFKITANFKKDARYALKKTAKADKRGGVTTTKIISSPSDLIKFHNAWRKSVKFIRFVPNYQSLINLCNSFSVHKPITPSSRIGTKYRLNDGDISAFDSSLGSKPRAFSNAVIILTSHNKSGSIIGGAIFTRSLHDYVYYWQAFTNKEGRTSLSQYSLVWKGLLWARKVGCKVFDFEGIFDSRFPNKSWLGFTHFKKSFGGKEVNFPGCYTIFRFPYFDR
jgi:lipid II:glycine glycyltransferase (peptidoglycan interpeptide bridge formation enzyme)